MPTGNNPLMTRSQLIEFLSRPGLLNQQTLDPMREVLDAYPFFQAGRLLWIKNLHLVDHIRFNSELKHAAAYIPDRSRLFFLIHDLQSPLASSQTSASGQTEAAMPGEVEPPVPGKVEAKDEKEPRGGFVFPAADLLDYEREGVSSASYSLDSDDTSSGLNPNESHSFSEWLSVLRHNPGNLNLSAEVPESQSSQPDRKLSLIDHFLDSANHRVRMVPSSPGRPEPADVASKSVQENDDLMTETLANIFIRQKHYRKAANIFERLYLKYPEKSVYFARRIKELEELINNQ